MRYQGAPVPATFKARPNRFLGEVEVDGQELSCFVPDPGRLKELLYPGSKVYLLKKATEHRKTQWDLVLVDLGSVLVSTDSRIPNKVVEEAVNAQLIPEFRDMKVEKRESVFEDSRLDFRLTDGAVQLLLEVKSCTLVRDKVGLFPDAPTERGSRHVRALMRALKVGRASIFFLIQREDAEAFRPYEEMDPRFAEALRKAAQLGVEVYAYNSMVTLEGVSLGRRVPVML